MTVDPYPDYMRESITKVEKTRDKRAKETMDYCSPDEITDVLEKFHPDFIKEQKTKLRFGVSKGEVVPLEVAKIVETRSILDPKAIDLKKIDFDIDVLVVGGGGAGANAALWAMKSGVKPENILIVTKLRMGDSNTTMAQGGIQAAVREVDNPAIHYLDAYGGGHYENDPPLVKRLVRDAPLILKWYEELGMMFDKFDDGTMDAIHGGGTSRKRMHFALDFTGLEIMRTLRDEVFNNNIKVLEFSPAVELIKDETGQVAGAVLLNLDSKESIVVRAKSTIITTGGFGRLHIQGFPTTNHYGATFDGCIMGYRAGAPLKLMKSVQYHPTGAAFPEQIVGLLVTEKVRGKGAQVLNKNGEQFCFPLETRDVEASLLIRECLGKKNGLVTPTGQHGLWLDSPLIDVLHGEGTIEKNFAAMVKQFSRFGVDIIQDPMLIYPTLHYQNGGLAINENSETKIKNLYAAGEVCGGTHGSNRLMGNSLLEISVFGRVAGITAAKKVDKVTLGKLTLAHVGQYNALCDEHKVKNPPSPILFPDYTEAKHKGRILPTDFLV
ncbi:MAG: FAD-binding protein [Candidatus Heimdallarchaeota archaeon]|nr:FAD-binding protein [Candidatus Heimdallarchaeota archaeon]MBY8993446.1 FAD-binding protein [Candidatus Heimdallarchaeota archaeon]